MRKQTIEAAMARLEEIARQMETADMDCAMELFREGAALSQFCAKRLETFRAEIQEIAGDREA